MKRAGLLGIGVLMVFVLFCNISTAQGPVKPQVSPVPLWPLDGNVSRLPEKQYVFLDASKGQWVVSYPEDIGSPAGNRRTLRIGRSSLTVPAVSVSVSRNPDGTYTYRYNLENGAPAKTPVERWRIIVPRNDPVFTASAANAGWQVLRSNRPMKTMFAFGTPNLIELEWIGTPQVALQAGSLGQAFTVTSARAPGFTQISVVGRSESELSPEALAQLPKPVKDQLARVLVPAWDSQVRMVIGPWFPSDSTSEAIAANFEFAVKRLSNGGYLNANSEFVRGALTVFSSYLESRAETSLNSEQMDFLSKAAPGLEADIAQAMRLTLSR